MKKINNKFFVFCLSVCCIICLSSFNANAVSLSHLSTDKDLLNTLNSKVFTDAEHTEELDFETDTSSPSSINSILTWARTLNHETSITDHNSTHHDSSESDFDERERDSSNDLEECGELDDILWISSTLLDYDWTLSGISTMSWAGSAPPNSHLAYQVRVGNATLTGGESFPIPEPSSFILIGIGCAGLYILKRKTL